MKVDPLEQYRLKKPAWGKTIGQGGVPSSFRKHVDGELVLEIKWGSVVEASAHTTNFEDYDPPKVHTDHLQELADSGQLEHLPQ